MRASYSVIDLHSYRKQKQVIKTKTLDCANIHYMHGKIETIAYTFN